MSFNFWRGKKSSCSKQTGKMIQDYRCYKGAWIFARNPHLEQRLSNEDKHSLFANGGLVIRNIFDFDSKCETSFWYVIKDSFGGMEELSAKMRNQVKRCFKTMKVEQITGDKLLTDGYDVFVSASENYKVKAIPPSLEEFKLRIQNSLENEYWGCFDIESNKLVAFSMNSVTNECCEYRTMKALPEYQKLYAYYGLIYEMNRYYLEVLKLKYVNDGSRSITNHSNIQPFLIDKFNFRKAYCQLEITYRWWLNMIIRCLYPFRKYVSIGQIKALLDMEAMARNEY